MTTGIVGLLRKRGPIPDSFRERIITPDEDFFDVDVMKRGHARLIILLHGLEGDSNRPYMMRMASRLIAAQCDVMAMNFRGCSGEPNRLLRSYHTGETGDVRFLIRKIQEEGEYNQIGLVGFSLGGNVLLKYLGEEGSEIPSLVRGGVVYSSPLDLPSSSRKLDQGINRIYVRRFLKTLIPKALAKLDGRIHDLDVNAIRKAKTFATFDEAFTAPVNGFDSAEDYWTQASSLPWLKRIHRPVLVVNAQDDPFLSQACFPTEVDINNPIIHLEYPRFGGHVAFPGGDRQAYFWSEHRAAHFLESVFSA